MVRIFRNGLIYGIVFFVLSFLIGYFTFNLSLNKTIIVSTPIAICALLINGLIL
jgi:hypothetical protein